jgi:hypothetical protein
MSCRSLFILLLAIVLSILQFTFLITPLVSSKGIILTKSNDSFSVWRQWLQRKRSTYIFKVTFFMKRKFKQWWSSTSPIATKQTSTSHLKSTHWTYTPRLRTTYDVGNLSRGLGRVQKCGGVKLANGIPTLPSVIPHKTTHTYSYIQEYFSLNWIWSNFSFDIKI